MIELDFASAAAATGAAFFSTFLRGIQNLNVANGYRAAATATGYCMNVADVVLIGAVATAGYEVALVSGIGAASGYWLSMSVHRKLTHKRRRLLKQEQKAKLIKRIRKEIQR